MSITYADRVTGRVVVATFERHTMSRVMREFPARRYEMVGYDFRGRPLELARGQRGRSILV